MKRIEDELEKIGKERLKDTDIFLMGRREHVEYMIGWFRKNGMEPRAVWDNDRHKQGGILSGIPIGAPGKKPSDGSRVVIYSPRHWENMKNQLLTLGFVDESEIIVLCRPSLERAVRRATRGNEILEELKKEFGADSFFFLMNCPLGDFYLMCLYLGQYCDMKGIKKPVVIGASSGISKLSGLFQIERFQRLEPEDADSLIQLWKVLGTERTQLKPLTMWQGDFRLNPCMTRQIRDMNFMDTFRHYALGLPEQAEPSFPVAVPDRDYTEKLFERLHLAPGRTAVIVPYSYSIHTLPADFWQRLIDRLVAGGYTVAVNQDGDREKNRFCGSVMLREDFSHMNDILEYAGTVIGVRCGFFDITSQAECRKIILYHEAGFRAVSWNRTDREFCGLKAMGLDEDAVELVIEDSENTESAIKRILAALTVM